RPELAIAERAARRREVGNQIGLVLVSKARPAASRPDRSAKLELVEEPERPPRLFRDPIGNGGAVVVVPPGIGPKERAPVTAQQEIADVLPVVVEASLEEVAGRPDLRLLGAHGRPRLADRQAGEAAHVEVAPRRTERQRLLPLHETT